MPRILLTNELGSGLGHINRLIAVARGLPSPRELIFAVPNPLETQPAVRRSLGADVEVVQGAVWQPSSRPDVRSAATQTFADVLHLFGFADDAVVQRNVDLWRSVVASACPDLVVADFAPTARLGSDAALPLLVVGNGFTVPPAGRPLPPIRPWQVEVPEGSRRAEAAVLGTMNAARSALALAPFPFVADAFSAPHTFVCSIGALDPYAPHRRAPLHQPFNVPFVEAGPDRDGRTGPAIFVYMPTEHPLFGLLLEVLNGIDVPVHIYATGESAEAVAAKCRRHVGVLRRMADLAAVLPKVRLVVHHAGLGTAYSAMMAGTPQFLLPRNLEHLITARGLIAAEVGQGYSVNANPSIEDLRRGILTMLDDTRWLERARAEAQRLHATLSADPLSPILDACDVLLQRPSQ